MTQNQSRKKSKKKNFGKNKIRGKMAPTLSMGLQRGPLQIMSCFGHKQTSKDTLTVL